MEVLQKDECYRQAYADSDSVFYEKIKKNDVQESDVTYSDIPLPPPKQQATLSWERVSPFWRPTGILVGPVALPPTLHSMG